MTKEQRDEYVEWIMMWSRWSREGLGKLNDRDLIREYERYRALQ